MINSILLNFIGNSPESRMTLVKDIDIKQGSTDYVYGSQGQYKTITNYNSEGIVNRIVLYYEDPDYPTKVTRQVTLGADEIG